MTAGYPEHLREEVDAYLATLRFDTTAPATHTLDEAMRYSLMAGGKRIRPVLALATAKAIREPTDPFLPLAAAIELIHTYSLIHDDLPAMDDDDLRRGRPTNHKVYGEDVAILAGDGLYAEAFALVLARQTGAPDRILAALRELADASGVSGMVGGQYLDVAGLAERGEVDVRDVHALKTGRLIAASVLCVLQLAGHHTGPTLEAFRAFASELGVLFQIVDDILDVTGTDERLGKPRGSDERHGRRTYVSIYGLDEARALAAESHREARRQLTLAAPTGAPELEAITDFIHARPS